MPVLYVFLTLVTDASLSRLLGDLVKAGCRVSKFGGGEPLSQKGDYATVVGFRLENEKFTGDAPLQCRDALVELLTEGKISYHSMVISQVGGGIRWEAPRYFIDKPVSSSPASNALDKIDNAIGGEVDKV